MSPSKIRLTIVLCCLSLISSAFAADSDGSYAVKGAGISSCGKFVSAAKNKKDLYLVYGGWVEGYITASNQHLDQTFDLAPWQSTQLLLKIIESVCTQNTEQNLHQVLARISADMSRQRIAKGGKFVDIDGKRNYIFQEEVIERIKQALKNKGLYTGPVNGEYTSDLQKSLKQFQKNINQNQSGLPDQGTLLKLFSQ
ncbi:MAG: peptidoglycan-binding protein [Gammaproteobacteria bacterium]|nr:peptidoglycan-binding protein [Gammaproteobacteria bacterium]